MTDDAVADLETGHGRADLDDLAGDVRSEDEGRLDPSVEDVAGQLEHPVEWVDGQGLVLDDDLILGRGSVGGRFDLESRFVRSEPGSCVGGHQVSFAFEPALGGAGSR